jgi:hypothetical protein
MEPYVSRWFWATTEVLHSLERDMHINEAHLTRLAQQGAITDELYQLGIDAFRQRMGVVDGALSSQARHDFAGHSFV